MSRTAILAVRVLSDSKQARGDLDRVGDSVGRLSTRAAKFKVPAAIVAGGLFAMAKGSIAAARESAAVNAQTAAVLKSTRGAANLTAKAVGDLANRISQKTGIDDEQIQSAENMLLTFTGIRNELGKNNDVFNQATQSVTDMSVAMGTDARSAAIQVGKALNNPIKGITALTRVGVTFTEAQKAQIKQMVKSGDTMGAQRIILAELRKEFGGSAAAQATSAKQAAVAWDNLKEVVGGPLNAALGFVARRLTGLFNLMGKHRTTVLVIGAALAAFSLAVFALNTAAKVAAAVTRAWAVAQAIFNAVMNANPLVLIITGLVLLGVALFAAYKKSETFRAIVTAAFNAIKAVAAAVVHFFITDIPAAFTWVVGFFKKWGLLVLVALVPFIGIPLLIWKHFSQIKGFIGRAFSAAYETGKHWVGLLVGVVTGIPGRILGVAKSMFNAGRTLISNLLDGLKNAAKAAVGFVGDMGKAIVNAISTAINKALHLPWIIKLHIKIPLAPDVNFGPYTILPSIPIIAAAPSIAAANLADLQPGFLLNAVGGSSSPWPADLSVAPNTPIQQTIVKVYFQGLVTDPDATARAIEDLLTRRATRTRRV